MSQTRGTRRIREDPQGHDEAANQVQEDTGGPAGILEDTITAPVRDREAPGSNPGPRPTSEFQVGTVSNRNVTGSLYYCSSSAAVLLDGGSRIPDVRPKFPAWAARIRTVSCNHRAKVARPGM